MKDILKKSIYIGESNLTGGASNMEDQAIICLFWDRDQMAIVETEKQYGRYCYSIAHRILKSHEDASECMNDTWLKAWQAIPPQRPHRFSVWLGKITRNLSLQRLETAGAKKRGGGEAELILSELENFLSDVHSPEDIASTRELSKEISHFLLSLPQDYQLVFVGRFYYFYTIQEIAAHTGLHRNNIHTLLYRTRQQLKQHLNERGYLYENQTTK